MFLVDSHCHLDFPDFATDLDAIIERARATGVMHQITISTRIRRFNQIVDIIERFDDVYGSVGTHCHNAAEEDDIPLDALIGLSTHPKIVAIGEAGLDYHYNLSPRDVQARGFRKHIAASRETGLPVVIHARDADEDVIAILQEEHARGPFPGVLHCFSSGSALALAGVELGLYVSFSGILTFKKSDELRSIARNVPRDRLLVETDAPYLAPMPHRGKRNEPAFVANTATVLGETLGIGPEEIAAITTENAFRLFSKMPRPSIELLDV